MVTFIFDIDATIIDSMPWHGRAWKVFVEPRGRVCGGEAFVRDGGPHDRRVGGARGLAHCHRRDGMKGRSRLMAPAHEMRCPVEPLRAENSVVDASGWTAGAVSRFAAGNVAAGGRKALLPW